MEKINAILVHEKDNVIVATEKILKDQTAFYVDSDNTSKTIKALDDITIYHKIAKEDIKKDEPVVKYGEHIGFALRDIKKGEHVHDHNIEGRREDLEAME